MLCPACDEFRFPSTSKSNILKSGPLPQPLPKETVTDTDEKPKDSVTKPVTTCLEVNDVLCFVKNKYGNYPATTIKSTMCDFFRDDEILSAKVTLLHSVGDKGLSLQQYSKKRIGDNKIKANVDDILGIWSTVDEGGLVEQLPTYCSAVTSRMPVISDELTDMAFMRMTILDLRDQITELRSQVADLHSILLDGHHVNARDTDFVKSQLVQISSSLDRADPSHSLRCPNSATVSDIDHSSGVSDNCRPTDSSELPSASYINTVEESDVAVNVSHSQPNSFADVIKTATSEDFQVVQSKKRRVSRRRVVVGGSTDNNISFKGVSKKSVFCVNRLELGTSTEVVSLFLKNDGISVTSCHLVKPRDPSANHENADSPRFISMHVYVLQADNEKILSNVP